MTYPALLDTNVALSALLFETGRLAWIRQAWQRQQLQPLVCTATARELIRALGYPKFQLTQTEQQHLLADFLPYAQVVEIPDPWPVLPACRDAKDQIFLVLAKVGNAQALVTGDRDLLAMQSLFPGLILTPDVLREQFPQQ